MFIARNKVELGNFLKKDNKVTQNDIDKYEKEWSRVKNAPKNIQEIWIQSGSYVETLFGSMKFTGSSFQIRDVVFGVCFGLDILDKGVVISKTSAHVSWNNFIQLDIVKFHNFVIKLILQDER